MKTKEQTITLWFPKMGHMEPVIRTDFFDGETIMSTYKNYLN